MRDVDVEQPTRVATDGDGLRIMDDERRVAFDEGDQVVDGPTEVAAVQEADPGHVVVMGTADACQGGFVAVCGDEAVRGERHRPTDVAILVAAALSVAFIWYGEMTRPPGSIFTDRRRWRVMR